MSPQLSRRAVADKAREVVATVRPGASDARRSLPIRSSEAELRRLWEEPVELAKGLTLRTAQQPGQRYMPRMLEHVQKSELDPSFLITHRMSLEDAPRGYAMFKDKEDGCVRAVFAP